MGAGRHAAGGGRTATDFDVRSISFSERVSRVLDVVRRIVGVPDYDRYVAHIDRRGLDLEDAPKLRELHKAIDLIRELYIRYHELLTRWTDAQVELSLDISNWRDPLKLAWITQPGAPDRT